jgi:glucokinase
MTYEAEEVVGELTVVAVDVGGTLLKGAVLTEGGVMCASYRVPTATGGGPDGVAVQVEQLVDSLAGVARRKTGAAPVAVGVVVPGVIDAEAGVVHYASNIGWSNLDLRSRVQAVLDVPVALGHDARAAAIAEATLGAARGVDSFLCLTLGTGIGGSLVLGGVPYVGVHGLAGEVGHIQAISEGPLCSCGERGCLETMASAAAIKRRYLERAGPDASRPAPHASDVLRLAAAGCDLAAVSVRDEAVSALGFVLTTLQRVVDLDLIVIGGGLCAAGDALVGPLGTELARRAAFQPAPRLVVSELGSEAGCHGAAVMAWQALGHDPAPGDRVAP